MNEATVGPRANAHKCHHGRCQQNVRCECGGQLAVEGTLHPLVDFGVGFVKGKFQVDRVYSKKVIGYKGFCMKCHKEGGIPPSLMS